MRRSHLIFPLLLASSLCFFTAKAQGVLPDTSFIQQAVAGAVGTYNRARGVQAEPYTGPEYFLPPKPHVEGHQFFREKTFKHGAVQYDGVWFEDVPLLYDVVSDEVITIHGNGGFLQMLVKERVNGFRLQDHAFIHLRFDSLGSASLQSGFFDLLYDGNVQLIAKRKKTLQERVSVNGREGSYDVLDRFFLKKDGIYHPVGNKRAVFQVLDEERKALKRFAKANKLRFRKKREEAILKTVQYYDTL